ncbi:MAG: hypothetical protein EP341_11450 [Sphingomonadales bacterium]|nr:MAG: hypothetical protein EP341_11450 [Sphingomonadales bacterium]
MTEDNDAPQLPADTQEAAALASTQYALTALQRCNLHRKTREAIEAMAFEGVSLPLAAQRVGMRTDNLARSFNKPHVRNAYNQVVAAIRDNAAQSAYLRINRLAETSESDRLKFDANRWLAGVDGISPVQKVEGRHQHNVAFGGFDIPRPEPLDVTPEDGQSPAQSSQRTDKQG